MARLLRLWRLGGGDLHLLWFAIKHPNRPAWLLPAAMMMAIYAVEPFNFAIPLLGLVDDFVILPLVLHALLRLLPRDIRAGFQSRAPNPI